MGNWTQVLMPSNPVCTLCTNENPPGRALRHAEVIEGMGRRASILMDRSVPANAMRMELAYKPRSISSTSWSFNTYTDRNCTLGSV